MKVLGAAIVTLMNMGTAPWSPSKQRCGDRERPEHARVSSSAPTRGRGKAPENCASKGRCQQFVGGERCRAR